MRLSKLLMAIAITLLFVNAQAQSNSTIKPVLTSYIALKDALVKTDAALSSQMANDLLNTIEGLNSNELTADVHDLWMKVMDDIVKDAKKIKETKEISNQRNYFLTLSKNMYSIVKISKLEFPVYYQFCPMANNGKGGNWVSLENKIKNPYYGNQMLTCGKIAETIQ